MKKSAAILAIIASSIVSAGTISYAGLIFPDAMAYKAIRAFLMLAFVPVFIGLIIGLIPIKVFRHGLLPWGFALLMVASNWLFFGKTWIETPNSITLSLILSFLILGVFTYFGVKATNAIKEK